VSRPAPANRRARRACAAALLLGLPALAACREAPLFEAPGLRPLASASWRLTYNPGDDRTPAWSADGDTVYYAATGFAPFPRSPGVLLALHRDGGAARGVFPALELASGRGWLTTPVPATQPGGVVVFGEVYQRLLSEHCAGATTCQPRPWASMVPRFQEVLLRTRTAGPGTADRDAPLLVSIAGVREDSAQQPFGLPYVTIFEDFPAHRLEREESVAFFRPSWSPEGTEVAFSDGLRLRVWHPASGGVRELPDTDDGVSAAWSPTGEWIAYSRTERGEPATTACVTYVDGEPACATEQHLWSLGRRTLVLVRPDGSEQRSLTEGDEPAWLPDGSGLVYRHAGALHRVGLDGAAPERLRYTDGGREPAVSPDGRYVAFGRRDDAGRFHIWIADLEAP
jgi:hypothetical protein